MTDPNPASENAKSTKSTSALTGLSAEQKRDLLAQLLAKKTEKKRQSFQLSHAQRRLWFMDQLQPGHTAYHIPAALRIDGMLEVKKLEQAINQVIQRHEVLRSCFISTEGEPSVNILAQLKIDLQPQTLTVHDLNRSSEEDIARQKLRTMVAEPFDLAQGPLLRIQLFCTHEKKSDSHYLLLCLHHIIADYWSLRLFIKEITALYCINDSSLLPRLPIQYVDYAHWQQQQTQMLEQQLNYWKKQLASPPPPLALPLDKPRPALQSSQGMRRHFQINAGLSQDLQSLAQQNQASLFVTLLTAFKVLLHRYTGQEDILVGSTVSNREHKDTRDLIGLFVNNLVLRANIKGSMAFSDCLQQVRKTTLDAFAHQDLPFEKLVVALQVERRLDIHPLFQVMFVLHNTPQQSIQLPNLTLSSLEADTLSTRFDLGLDISETPQGLHGTFEFSTDLFDASSIDQLILHFTCLLEAIVKQPTQSLAELPWAKTGGTQELGPEQTVESLDLSKVLAQSFEALPTKTALVCGSTQLSYLELQQKTNQLMHALCLQGLQLGDRVALCLPRTADLLIAMLACLRLGLPYIPLDIRHPKERLQAMIDDAEPATIIHTLDLKSSEGKAIEWTCPQLNIEKERNTISNLPITIKDKLIPKETHAYIIFTSGSTGRPKGVPISRLALANFLLSMQKKPGLTEGDRLLAVTTVAFDIAVLELLLPLSCGAKLILADEETVQDSQALSSILRQYNITQMQATPATWRLLLDGGWQGQKGLTVLCGGEALDKPLAQRLLKDNKALWNMYGPTETTIWSAALHITQKILDSSQNAIPVGDPIFNTWLAVVGENQQVLPQGVPGELLIGGDGLSPGYLQTKHSQNSNLNKEKFILFNGISGISGTKARAYRTGDRVRQRKDGLLEFLGRVDHQIKLRGFRIEPGEIEAALIAHGEVEHCVVGLYGKDPQLVAWYKPFLKTGFEKSLRTHLSKCLPRYMQPSILVAVDKFPLNSNGKVDRNALPEPDSKSDKQNDKKIKPIQGETSIRLAVLWSTLLPLKVSSADDNFFFLGGHSLLAARMLAQVQKQFSTLNPDSANKGPLDISLRTLFEHPTLEAFSQKLQNTLNGKKSTQQNQPSGIIPVNRSQPLVLSSAQQRQWVLAQLEPDNPFYNIPAAIQINEILDISILQKSIQQLCQRHENLRTCYPELKDKPIIQVMESVQPNIEQHDLSDLRSEEKQHFTAKLLSKSAQQPFNLNHAPLLRLCVVKHTDNRYVVLLVLHHILADAWSMNILLRDLSKIYTEIEATGTLSSLSPLTLQYADYAAWQLQLNNKAGLQYWQKQLANAPILLDLPTDFSRPLSQSFVGGSIPLNISSKQLQTLEHLAQDNNATLFMLLLTLWQWLLSCYSETEDIVVGTPVGHRPQAELDEVIGLFSNTLALRTHIVKNATLESLLEQVRQTVIDGFSYQQVPFDEVIETLNVPRNWAHAPLFQVMFLWQPASPKNLQQNASQTNNWVPLPLPSHSSKFDLSLSLVEEHHGIAGRLDFRRDLFKAETIEFMADAFYTLIQGVCEQSIQALKQPLNRICLAGPEQLKQMTDWNKNNWPTHGVKKYAKQDDFDNLIEPFLRQVQLQPNACALIVGKQQLSYRELDQHSDLLAQQLLDLGVKPESFVGICLPRNQQLIIALIATLKVGSAYLPLDPAYPAERLSLILKDAEPSVLIALKETSNTLLEDAQQYNITTLLIEEELSSLATRSQPLPEITRSTRNHAAYLIYTSGSTGQPKGVVIEHQQALAMVEWAANSFSSEQLKGTLVSTSVCFDLSVFEIFVPLATGGSLILIDSVLGIFELPAIEQVSLINTVPTAAAELLRLGDLPSSINTVNLAGEPIPAELLRQLYQQKNVNAVYNLYGPSEDTTYSTGLLLPEPTTSDVAQLVPIGRPITNTQAYVLNEQDLPVAIGMTGELLLGGAGVARGYWRRPDLTDEKFISITDPLSRDHSTRLYRTGDRVRLRADGHLEFLGRRDQQVKIRGFRIETGDIEAALQQHEKVQQAIVIAITLPNDSEQGHKRLLAYIVGDFNKGKDSANDPASFLRRHLQSKLPDFMIPAEFIILEKLPLLPNGKINRNNLPLPKAISTTQENSSNTIIDGNTITGGNTDYAHLYQLIQGIWQTLLGCTEINENDHFFEKGGDSILAIQVVARIRQAGIPIAPRDLFQYPTLATLTLHAMDLGFKAMPVRPPVVGALPLLPMQHWFFQQKLKYPEHWNQSLLLDISSPLDVNILEETVKTLANHHDVLRANFIVNNGQWQQHYAKQLDITPLQIVRKTTQNVNQCIEQTAQKIQASFDLNKPPLWQLVYFDLQGPNSPARRLLLVSHHLLIDGVSWRILLEDLQSVYQQISLQKKPQLPPRSHSAIDWVNALQKSMPHFNSELEFWKQQCTSVPSLPLENKTGSNQMSDVKTASVSLSLQDSERLLQALPASYAIHSDELLMTALLISLQKWSGQTQLQIALEGHGREDISGLNDDSMDIDLSRTIGWFTSLYPLNFNLTFNEDNTDEVIKTVKTHLRSVPNKGLGYGILGYLGSNKITAQPQVRFNYLGQTDNLFSDQGIFTPAKESTGQVRHPDDHRDVLFDINALVSKGQLRLHWSYSQEQYQQTTIEQLVNDCLKNITLLLNHCLSGKNDGGLVPQDFPQMDFDADELDSLLDDL